MINLFALWIGIMLGNMAYFGLRWERDTSLIDAERARAVDAFIWPTVTLGLVAVHHAIFGS
jgi:hypothetical protein